MLAFATTQDAVRFCHSAQMKILYTQWPADAQECLRGIEFTPDGRLLFSGLRVAMAVHESSDYR